MKNVEYKSKNSLKLVLIIAFLSSICVFLWVNRYAIYPGNILIFIEDKINSLGKGEDFPRELNYETVMPSNFNIVGSNIIALSNSNFVTLNKNGKVIFEEQHNFAKPIVKTSRFRSIIYDVYGENYKIKTLSKMLFLGKTADKILCCSIAENGMYGIVTGSEDYSSELVIYGRNNKEIFKYTFFGCSIMDISLNHNGNKAVICGISTKNGVMNSNIYILNLNSKKTKVELEFPENTIYSVQQYSDGNIVAIGDKSAVTINCLTNSKREYFYDNKKLVCSDFNKNFGICLCLSVSNDGNNCEIVTINKKGDAKNVKNDGRQISSISYKNERIAALIKNKIILYNQFGTIEKEIDTEIGVKKIILNGCSAIYTLENKKINKIKV